MKHHNTFPQRHVTIREHRLLFEAPNNAANEMYKQQAINVLGNAAATEDQLERLKDVIQKNNSPELLTSIQKEVQKMPEQQRKNVEANLNRLRQRQEAANSAKEEDTLQALEQALEHTSAPKSTAESTHVLELDKTESTVPFSQESFLKGVGDSAEKVAEFALPTRWTDKLSHRQKVAAGAALTVGAGIVLWQLGKRLFGSYKSGKEAASGSKGGFFKKLLIGAGIGLASFFGIKYLLNKFGKDLEKKVMASIPPIPSGESVKAAFDAAETASGIGAGVVNKTTKSAVEQVDALSEIPHAAYDLLAKGDFEAMAGHGWMFLKKEGEWIFQTATNGITVPAEFVRKYLSGEVETNFEGGWMYGEAGASYILGKATINAILTGKIRVPLTVRSLSMTAGRMAAWPLMIMVDGAKTARLLFDADGRIITKGAAMRWGPLGVIRDFNTGRKISKGTAEGLKAGLKYFQEQNVLIAAMEREVDGLSKGLVRQESINALKKSMERMANDLGKMANKLEADLLAKNADVPGWLAKMAEAGRMSKADKITAAVDDAGALLQQSGKAADVADELSDVAKGAEILSEESKLSKAVAKIVEKLAELKKLGQSEEILKLLNSPVIKQAAKLGNNVAAKLGKMAAIAAKYKVVGRGMLILGPLIDTFLIWQNSGEMEKAKKEGNAGMVQTLESKHVSLYLYGATGLGVGQAAMLMSAPAGLVIVPVYVASSMYADKIYEEVLNWEKTKENWMQQDPKELIAELQKRKPGYRDAAGYWGAKWRNPFLERSADAHFDDSEQINAVVRYEILAALFLQRMKLYRSPEETEEQFKERATTALRDRMNFIDSYTMGSFNMSSYSNKVFEMAEGYADLAAIRRERMEAGLPLTSTYEVEGKTKELDLSSLSYVIEKKDNDATLRKSMYQTINQYQTDLKVQREAVAEFLSAA